MVRGAATAEEKRTRISELTEEQKAKMREAVIDQLYLIGDPHLIAAIMDEPEFTELFE